MKTFPLEPLSLEQAMALQFALVEAVTEVFKDNDILSQGDLGLAAGYNCPAATRKTEQALARFFKTGAALLVRGAGTGALCEAFFALLPPGGTLLVHDAPLYATTEKVLDRMGCARVSADFNDAGAIEKRLLKTTPDAALIQHSRQHPSDGYDLGEVIKTIRTTSPGLPVITDDNYAALKVKAVGAQLGADLSAFSLFKLMGPEGVGCITGKTEIVDRIAGTLYSGGSRVQGHEALDALRALCGAPVLMAVQAMTCEAVRRRLNQGETPGVKQAYITNAQSRVVLVELERPVAKAVIRNAAKLGAATRPVGAESRYEVVPLFYRVSGAFKSARPGLENRMLRINPMRAGAGTVIRILTGAVRGAD